ncbi:hypothetical protein DSO57_1015346 [Entomophthora muscae]|uniref:Uncharacterized protein n=1 Tax=Entomophthora muscae TaxID=34485 RepID=A0ACC2USC7_9FUNG|nr:hypothetical protein DSO57_1015346 [Entomophthora muscae]
MDLNLWAPLAPSQPTSNLANYMIPSVTLLFLAGSLRPYNILAKSFHQAINLYPIVYALNGFELPNLTSYVTKVLPSILGFLAKLGQGFGVAGVGDSWPLLAIEGPAWVRVGGLLKGFWAVSCTLPTRAIRRSGASWGLTLS